MIHIFLNLHSYSSKKQNVQQPVCLIILFLKESNSSINIQVQRQDFVEISKCLKENLKYQSWTILVNPK